MRYVFHLLLSAMLLLTQRAFTQVDTLKLPFGALTIDQGLSQGLVNAIAQDKYGFLWFATKDGLDRYDGYTFTVFRHDPDDSTSIQDNMVSALHIDQAQRLWVGTSQGVDLFDPVTERFIHLPVEHPDGPLGLVHCITMDDNGDLWASTPRAMVKVTFSGAVEPGKPWPSFTLKWYDGNFTFALLSDGRLWGGPDTHILRIAPKHDGSDVVDTLPRWRPPIGKYDFATVRFLEDSARKVIYGVARNYIVAIDRTSGRSSVLYEHPYPEEPLGNEIMTLDHAGILWLPTVSGLYRFDPQRRSMALIRAADTDQEKAMGDLVCAFMERSGTLWIGSSGYGLVKYDPRIERFNNHADRSIRSLVPTPSGAVLVGRYFEFMGVFDPSQRAYTTRAKSVKDVAAGALLNPKNSSSDMAVQDADGIYWLAMNDGEIIRYDARGGGDMKLIVPRIEPGVPDGGPMFPLMLDAGSALWFGGDHALWRCDIRTNDLTPFRWPVQAKSDPYPFTAALHEGKDGIIWACTMSGLLRLDPRSGEWKHYRSEAGNPRSFPTDVLFSICPDPDDPTGVLWIGTSGGGLARFDTRTGDVERITTKNGLPNDVVYGVLADSDGRLWMSTNKGVARYDRKTNAFRNFTVSDGLQSNEFNRYAYCKDAKGWLWFGGVNGFNYFDPHEFVEDTTAVPVRITGVLSMNKPVSFRQAGSPLSMPAYLSSGMRIPHSANMVSFSFASMEFSAPELHRYQYKLEGFDPVWIDVGTDNSAVYTNLDPGTYTFHVRGRNRDGIWDENGTAFTLSVDPPWWRTWWFYTLCGLVCIGGTSLYIRILRKQKGSLERAVAERTYELRREKDRSEELLNNILPAGVAAELKYRGHAEARHFDQVTVLFSDFREFTRVTEQLSPADLVEELNVCFNAFDRIMEKYGVEKIKTIGDAYMAAGGVPDPSGGMPLAVVLAGLEMQHIIAERRIEREAQGKVAFAMRLGIHSGPVVAGIVGRRKFQYDIWGDTVNIASRMETTGDVGEVNISGATYALVKHEPCLSFIARGKVQAKGKGELEMYYARHASDSVRTGMERNDLDAPANGIPIATIPPAYLTQRLTGQRATRLKDLRILLVDDNNFNVLVAQSELEYLVPGVKVDVAENGAIAVERVKRNAYDLVLMDVQMPVMDGYQSTRTIRALPGDRARVPIIALTANVMQAEVERCRKAGMNDFVPKPFKPSQLLEAMERVVGNNASRP